MSSIPLFDSHEELRQMLFESLEAEGFKCEKGMPIHENMYGQKYRHHVYISSIENIATKSDAIKILHNMAVANFTTAICSPFMLSGSEFDFCRAIEFRSIDICTHSIKKDHIWFYLRGVSRDESLPVKWQYDSEGKIQEAISESTKQDN